MVLCLYANPTIDKTVYLKEFKYGDTNRAGKVVTDGAGKAVNTAVVLKELGQDVKVIGLLYKLDGEIIKSRLEEHKIEYDFIELDGIARTNTKIFDESTKTVTEINESGASVSAQVMGQLADKLYGCVGPKDSVVLTGSLPPGCEADYYARLIKELRQKGVKCILDADGDALKLGVAQQPYMIKPNENELGVLTGNKPESIQQAVEACKKLAGQGISVIAVSMGGDGALLYEDGIAWFAYPLHVDILSTVGAGDSMVAGIVAKIAESPQDMLQSGVAAATASITLEGTKLCTKDLYNQFYPQVKMEQI